MADSEAHTYPPSKGPELRQPHKNAPYDMTPAFSKSGLGHSSTRLPTNESTCTFCSSSQAAAAKPPHHHILLLHGHIRRTTGSICTINKIALPHGLERGHLYNKQSTIPDPPEELGTLQRSSNRSFRRMVVRAHLDAKIS